MVISKLNAAKRQLAAAIWMHLEDRDPVSIHTLASAAKEIVDKLCELKGVHNPIGRRQLLDMIVPERQKEVGNWLNIARNFFKHLGPQAVIDFNEETNWIVIASAASGLQQLGVQFIELYTFFAWFTVTKPELFTTEELESVLSFAPELVAKPDAEKKSFFLALLRDAIMRKNLPCVYQEGDDASWPGDLKARFHADLI